MGKVGSKAILVRRTITFLHMFVFFHTFEGKKIEAAEALLLKQKFKEFTNAKKKTKVINLFGVNRIGILIFVRHLYYF